MTEPEYQSALDEAEALMDATDEVALKRLDFLCRRIETYESIHCPIKNVSADELFKHLKEANPVRSDEDIWNQVQQILTAPSDN